MTHRHAILTRAGYAVTSAAQPLKALYLLDKHSFDLVLVGTHGNKEHAWIQRIQRDRNLRVVFLVSVTSDTGTSPNYDREVLRKVAEAFTADLATAET